MAETAAHLTDQVFPRLPVRQWALFVPKRRARGADPNPSRDQSTRFKAAGTAQIALLSGPWSPKTRAIPAFVWLNALSVAIQTYFINTGTVKSNQIALVRPASLKVCHIERKHSS